MYVRLGFCFALLLFVGLGALCAPPAPAGAQAKAPPAEQQELGPGVEVFAALKDEPFDEHLDVRQLAQALAENDVDALMKAAADLAAGEKALGRNRKAITSEAILRIAIRSAASSQDKETLDRLEKLSSDLKKDRLLRLLSAARETSRTARSAGPQITIDASQDLSGLLAYQRYLNEIQNARVFQDFDSLVALSEGLDVGPVMDENLRSHIAKLIKSTLEQVPHEESPEDDALRQLAEVTRGTGSDSDENEPSDEPVEVSGVYLTVPAMNQGVVRYARNQWHRKVGNGQCAALNRLAIESASKKSFTVKGSPQADDYIWGTNVGTITSGRYSDLSKLTPGDLLQFRDVSLKGSYKNSSGTHTYTKSARHHSAVVYGINASKGYVYVYNQNSNGKLYVTRNLYRLKDLKSGTIWAYRYRN